MARLNRHRMNPQPPTDAAKTRRRYAPRLAPGKRREQLIDAALSVIVEQGYEGVSIESIARVAGVTRPVIYDHFANLGQLLQALIEREEAYALAQLDAVVPPELQAGGDPPAMFAAGVRRFLDAVASRPNTWRVILLPPEGTPAVVREQVETNRARLLARLTQFVRWAVDQAGIRSDLDIEICARAILRLSEEAGRMVLTDPDRFSPERYERFAHAVMDLIWSARLGALGP
ncbi:MAG: TetR/AcrR family transcriptional regulator [Solirubrobacteraceae bacterium]